jgi:endonuclease-3
METKKAIKQLNEIRKLKGDMRLAAEAWPTDFQILISIILSARTLDETTIRVCNQLFAIYPDAKSLSKAKISEIQKIINPINFYRNKSRNLSNCAKILVKEFEGKVPIDFNQLITLPGVGGKTANVFLSEKGKDTIGVDTHVFYISRYLDWSNSNKPELVEKDLMNLFPRSYWKQLNPDLVKFGKKYTSRKEKNKLLNQIKEK